MTSPAWFPGLATLDLDALALRPLRRLLDLVAPGGGPVPVVVQRADGDPGATRTWEGSATLWDSDLARFGITVDDADAPTSAWVAKPMSLAAGIAVPGLDADVLWMVLSAEVDPEPWTGLDPTLAPPLDLDRHLVGVVTVVGRRLLVRLDARTTSLAAEIDFDGALTDVESAAIGRDLGALGAPPGLRDLARLLGTDHDPDADLRWLPEILRDHELLTLDRLRFTLGTPDDGLLTSIGAEVMADLRWPLVPGFDALSVETIRASFDIDHPLDPAARSPRVSVEGVVALAGATLSVRARWPDLAVEASLVDGHDHPLRLAAVLAAAHLPAFTEPDPTDPTGHGPEVTELDVSVRPGDTPVSFAVHTRIADVLEIPLGRASLRLRDLRFDVALPRGAASNRADRALEVDVWGELLVATDATATSAPALVLRATSDQGGTGWTLRAGLAGPLTLDALRNWLTDLFGVQPIPAGVLGPTSAIEQLDVEVGTATKHAALRLVTGLDLGDGVTGRLELDLALTHLGAGAYAGAAQGRFTVGGTHRFDLLVARDGGATAPAVVVAAYRNSGSATVGELLAAVGVPGLPIPVVLSGALLAMAGDQRLALVDMGVGFDLSQIPVIGRLLPPHETIALDLRFVAASGAWDEGLVGALDGHLPAGYAQLDRPAAGTHLPTTAVVVALRLGEVTLHLQEDLGVGVDPARLPPPKGSPAAVPGAQPPVRQSGAAAPTWQDTQRSFGPIHLRRVGASVGGGAIALLLDGELALGGLTVAVQGLSVSVPLDGSRPTIGFSGLGLDLRQGDLELSGALLRVGGDRLLGAALLRAGQLSLSAVGAYGTVGDGQPSLFVYAVLDYPLGGPAFFFVTGLAAGFGYNRRVIAPSIDKVQDFPLVREATTGGKPKPDQLLAKLQTFEDALPESLGDVFAAAGLRFTSFRTIDSFALLLVSFGTAPGSRFRIDLLGTSTLIAPAPLPDAAPVPPVAEIHIAFRAQFVPEEGFLGLEAQLTAPSYVLSDRCHLTGGAAFYSWLAGDRAGDFVVSVGGYHPDFRPPPHYPRVPRVGFAWTVTPELALKGDLYYALTGHAIMAGGHLEAVYDSGATGASFRAGIDMLATWQPFTYTGHAYVHVAAHWNALQAEVGADVRVWGPPFAGVAEVDLYVTSFTVHFGDTRPPEPEAVGWDEFRATALPTPDAVLTIACTRGMVAQVTADTGYAAEWVVSAHDLVLEVSSRAPSSTATLTVAGGSTGEVASVASFHAAPMRAAASSVLDVRVTPAGAGPDLVAVPVHRTVPAAMWGAPPPAPDVGAVPRPEVNAAAQQAALVGVELRPPRRAAAAETRPVPLDQLAYFDPPRTQTGSPERANLRLRDYTGDAVDPSEIAANRAAVLVGFGVDPGGFRPGPPDPFRDPPRPVDVDATGIL